MAGEDWVAGIMGALAGGAQGMDLVRRRRLEEAEARRRAEQQAFQNALALETAARAARADQRAADRDLRTQYEEALNFLPPGEDVDPSMVSEAQRLGLGYRLEERRTLPSSRFEGLVGLVGDPNAPGTLERTPMTPERGTGTFQRRETPADREARAKAEAEARERQSREQARTALLQRRPDLSDTFTYGDATGKLPTSIPLAPEVQAQIEAEKRARDLEDYQKRQDYRHGLDVSRLRLSDSLQRDREASRPARQTTDPSERAYQRAHAAYLRDNPDDYEGAAQAGQAAYEADARLRADREGKPRNMGRPSQPVVVGRGAPTGQPTRGAAPPAPSPYKPGDRVKTRDGRVVTVRRVLPDGRIETF